jgi:hypothetical protein
VKQNKMNDPKKIAEIVREHLGGDRSAEQVIGLTGTLENSIEKFMRHLESDGKTDEWMATEYLFWTDYTPSIEEKLFNIGVMGNITVQADTLEDAIRMVKESLPLLLLGNKAAEIELSDLISSLSLTGDDYEL